MSSAEPILPSGCQVALLSAGSHVGAVVADHVIAHPGVDQAGTDAVHPDVVRREIEGHAPRQVDDGSLRRRIGRGIGSADHPGDGSARLVITPDFLSIIGGTNCCETRKTLFTLVSMTASQVASLRLATVPGRQMPALFTRMSMYPTSARIAFATWRFHRGLVTSSLRKTSCSRPRPLFRRWFFTLGRHRHPAERPERPPRRVPRAVARPMPLAAPVTTAVFPFSLMRVFLDSRLASQARTQACPWRVIAARCAEADGRPTFRATSRAPHLPRRSG